MSQPEDRLRGDAIQAEIARYPTRRGAILPALRLAQERDGWLSPDALRAVAEAIGFSPAYCQSVASFYDMFFLEPIGRHTIEVCTNVACALCGAGEVMDAFEDELGIRQGETTPDGAITLRKVECLGGCGYAPVVAVDERYHEGLTPDDVPELVARVRAAPRVHR
jgi:NADH-quinone oxidoreductase subunit E